MAEKSLQSESTSVTEMDTSLAAHKKTTKTAQTDIDNEKQNMEITKKKREAVRILHALLARSSIIPAANTFIHPHTRAPAGTPYLCLRR